MKEIVDTWDGPVVHNGDRYFEDLESAVSWIADDAESDDDIPEYLECCDREYPQGEDFGAELIIEQVDENFYNEEGQSWSDCLDEEARAELQTFINGWFKRQEGKGYAKWSSNRKYVRVKEDIEKEIIETSKVAGCALKNCRLSLCQTHGVIA